MSWRSEDFGPSAHWLGGPPVTEVHIDPFQGGRRHCRIEMIFIRQTTRKDPTLTHVTKIATFGEWHVY